MTARRISLWISAILALVAIAPAIAFALGLGLNMLWGCDIRDESGTIYGDCATWQSDIAYSLLLMPWLLLVTLSFAGIPAAVAVIVTLILYIVHWTKRAKT